MTDLIAEFIALDNSILSCHLDIGWQLSTSENFIMKLASLFLINAIEKSSAFAEKSGSGDTINDFWFMKESSTIYPFERATFPFERTRKPSKFASKKQPKEDLENTWVCGDGKVIPMTKIIGKKKKLSQKSFTEQMFKACDYSLNRAQCFEARSGSFLFLYSQMIGVAPPN